MTQRDTKTQTLLRLLRLARREGLLLEIRLRDGSSLDGYWPEKVSIEGVSLSNATLEQTGATVEIVVEDVRTVHIL